VRAIHIPVTKIAHGFYLFMRRRYNVVIKKFFARGLFGIGYFFCMIGGCALDSKSLSIPMGLIGIGLVMGFLGYRQMRRV
jgi:hypothetical protein